MNRNSRSGSWLSRIAEGAGLPLADSGTPAPDADLRTTWADISRSCGIEEADLAVLVADHFGLALANLDQLDETALKLIPAEFSKEHGVLALRQDYGRLVVATYDPTDIAVEQEISFVSGRRTIFELAPPGRLHEVIRDVHSPERAVKALLDRVHGDIGSDLRFVPEAQSDITTSEASEAPPIVRLANLILAIAVDASASDVHIQGVRSGGVVRLRVDGVLRSHMRLPHGVFNRLVARFKVMGKLDIADRLRPQDGLARISASGRNYNLRISTVPVRGSEKVVIRVLDTGEHAEGLQGIGIPTPELERFRRLLTHREGLIVLSGPSGSGKTTTLYAALWELSSETVNIMTVEDPIEYELKGMTQIQVEEKKGVTFPSALRAILRQDPDIILIGEIRDRETAQIAIQASMTGHLVLTTLHANDAVGTLRRLTDLGLDARSVTQALRGASAQRLLRRLCTHCSTAADDPLTEEERRLASHYRARPVSRAVGCERCGHSGYRGRLPVMELFSITPRIEELVLRDASATEITAALRMAAIRSLRDSALELAERGETTLAEIERVLGERGANGDQSSPGEDSEASDRIGGQRVLMVDDDGAYRTIARALLEKIGCHVTEASDGARALELLGKGQSFDLLVLDLNMPNVGGREVLAQVRSSIATAAMPVIVLTSDTEPQIEVQLLNAGADDYIRKPMDPERFMVRVQAALRRAGA